MTNEDMEAVEAARAKFRPERITTLFVGESAPFSGDFYYGNSAMTRHMQSAVEHSLGGGEGSDFLERFKAYGWYLDDLVLTPVNNLTKSERRAKCLAAQKSLADRIVKYRPLANRSSLASPAGNRASFRLVVDFARFGKADGGWNLLCDVKVGEFQGQAP